MDPHISLKHPTITRYGAEKPLRAVVLVLHGGRAHSTATTRPWQLSPLRMVPFARDLHRRGAKDGLEVWRVRNRVRGWNGEQMDALADARYAVQKAATEHPGVPIFVLGHSMGGLTALAVASEEPVKAVVALAPWVDEKTPRNAVAGVDVLIIHGSTDRITNPVTSREYAEDVADIARSVEYLPIAGVGHFMLSQYGLWQRRAADFVLDRLANLDRERVED